MRGYEREKNLGREKYLSERYFSYGQLWSFVEQIHHIRAFSSQSLIEIGVGNGFVSTFLRTIGLNVKTFDINPDLMPDIVAKVQDIKDFVSPNEFDLISCCEVLEHMPFEEFEITIRSFSELSNGLFLTLPINGRNIGMGGLIKLPKFQHWFSLWLRLPVRSLLPDMHFWEINYDHDTSEKAILKLLNKYYHKVDSGYFKLNHYHRYFKCSGSRSLQKKV